MLRSLLLFRDEVLRDVSALGGVFFTTLVPVLVLLLGEAQLFYRLAASLSAVYVVNISIRSLYFKERPRKERHSDWVQRIYASAFPSMHSMRAWCIATLCAWFFADVVWAVLLVALSCAVSYARIVLEKHYVIDVVAGGVLGAGIALGVVYLL